MTFSLMSWDKIGVGNAVCAHIDFGVRLYIHVSGNICFVIFSL